MEKAYHVVAERYHDELGILGSFLDIACDDGDLSPAG